MNKILSCNFETILKPSCLKEEYSWERIHPEHIYGSFLYYLYEEYQQQERAQGFITWTKTRKAKKLLKSYTKIKNVEDSVYSKYRVEYLDSNKRKDYLIETVDNKLYWQDSVLSTDPERAFIVVLSLDQKLYGGYKEIGEFHHSSFIAGYPIAFAGGMSTSKGIPERVDNWTGHYNLQPQAMEYMKSFLVTEGFDLAKMIFKIIKR